MNLKTNKSFVFSFWQKNGVLLTKISMFYKEWSVKNSLLTLVGMPMVFDNCILNAGGNSCVHGHCLCLQKSKSDKNG